MKKGNDRQELGKKSEDLAALWLERNRFRVLSRNFRYYTGEIDIVASRNGVLYLVEVRSRKAQREGFRVSPGEIAESISKKKLAKIVRTGLVFMKKKGLEDKDVNILIMAITWYNPRRPKVRVIPVY